MTDQTPSDLVAQIVDDTLGAKGAELEVLGATWWNPTLTTTLNLTEADFWSPINGQLWDTLTQLHGEGLTPDPTLVQQRTPRQMRSATNELILSIISLGYGTPNAEAHANTIRQHAHRRTLLAAIDRARQILNNPDADPDLAFERLDQARTGDTTTPATSHDRAVQERATKLRIERDARALLAEDQEPDPTPPDAGTLTDILNRPPEPAHRVEGLIPSDASTLLVAQRKTGKTTLLLNYARTLITGEHFLGQFPARPLDGNVAFLNYEVSGAQLARWAHDIGIHPDRLWIENLRGRRNPLTHPGDRQALVERLRNHNTKALIVDPFGRAYTGLSQNDPGEVGAWLTDLDRFTRSEVEATDLILATHAGWNGERTRGASALEDWPDSIITMTRDDKTGDRYIRAMGRDVELDEDRLLYDPTTRWLSITGDGSRRQAAENQELDQAADLVATIVDDNFGINATELENRLRAALRQVDRTMQKGYGARAASRAEQLGTIYHHDGSRGAKHYYPVTTDTPGNPFPPPPETLGGGQKTTPPTPPTSPGGTQPTLTSGNTTETPPPPTSPNLPQGDVATSPSSPFIRELGGVAGDPTTTTKPRGTCARCGHTMVILNTGQTHHPGCQPTPTSPPTPDNDPPPWLNDRTAEPPF